MAFKNPFHPGEAIKELCLKPLKLSVTSAAEALGVSRVSLSELLNGKNGISTEMAYRLSKAFGSTPEFWLRLQMAHDLAQVKKKAAKLKVKRLHHNIVKLPNKTTLKTLKKTDAGKELNEYKDVNEFLRKMAR